MVLKDVKRHIKESVGRWVFLCLCIFFNEFHPIKKMYLPVESRLVSLSFRTKIRRLNRQKCLRAKEQRASARCIRILYISRKNKTFGSHWARQIPRVGTAGPRTQWHCAQDETCARTLRAYNDARSQRASLI